MTDEQGVPLSPLISSSGSAVAVALGGHVRGSQGETWSRSSRWSSKVCGRKATGLLLHGLVGGWRVAIAPPHSPHHPLP